MPGALRSTCRPESLSLSETRTLADFMVAAPGEWRVRTDATAPRTARSRRRWARRRAGATRRPGRACAVVREAWTGRRGAGGLAEGGAQRQGERRAGRR